MRETIKECPKTYNKYLSYLKDKYRDNYGEEMPESFPEEMILVSIEATPGELLPFFDTLNLIGTYSYDYMQSVFIIQVNGMALDPLENDEDAEYDESFPFVYGKDRLETEEILIKYLFLEAEKTL